MYLQEENSKNYINTIHSFVKITVDGSSVISSEIFIASNTARTAFCSSVYALSPLEMNVTDSEKFSIKLQIINENGSIPTSPSALALYQFTGWDWWLVYPSMLSNVDKYTTINSDSNGIVTFDGLFVNYYLLGCSLIMVFKEHITSM